ncbi:MAG: site-2 protease family protein [Oscillospiraceae bacterium]|nr:site-2 protease family protein [Oscillospiraceae bacterium]
MPFSFNISTDTLLTYLVRLMIILLINPLHECAHAYTAHKLGDDTARDRGRLTLDPIAHIDIMGAGLLFFFGFGWAKPVPVDPRNFKDRRLGMMLTAIAGPLSNLIAAFLGIIAYRLIGASQFIDYASGYILRDGETMYYVAWMLYVFVVINLNLCLFNLVPVPPLDGSRVLGYFLPPRAELWLMRNQRVFYGIMMLLMITGILSLPLSFLNHWIMQGMLVVTKWIPAVL